VTRIDTPPKVDDRTHRVPQHSEPFVLLLFSPSGFVQIRSILFRIELQGTGVVRDAGVAGSRTERQNLASKLSENLRHEQPEVRRGKYRRMAVAEPSGVQVD